MSNSIATEQLRNKIAEFKIWQEIRHLIESMGLFAILELLETHEQTLFELFKLDKVLAFGFIKSLVEEETEKPASPDSKSRTQKYRPAIFAGLTGPVRAKTQA